MKVMKRSRKSEETLTSCMDEMRQTRGHLEPRDVCARNECHDLKQNKTNEKTTRTFTCSPSVSLVKFHVLCVDLGFHVVIGVGRLTVRFYHAHAFPCFLLDVVVRLCPVIVNSDCSHNSCILHIAKTGPVRCCPYMLPIS